jgi:2-polyprenyl-3-methyl-5-hydroxy-6-metoxy-1,4-benzoquinol methylase
MTHPLPSEAEQREFWNLWNSRDRNLQRGIDPFMQRQSEVAMQWASIRTDQPLRILEVGCGTGWLSAQLRRFGEVTGVDLSPQAIADAQSRASDIRFIAGDFATLALDGPFSYVVSADVIAHVPDHAQFIERIAKLMRPGGTFVLMTQNPFVWNRSSNLSPQGKGQIRNWPSRGRLVQLLRRHFRVQYQSSIVPQGDRGVLRLTSSYKLNAAMKSLLGEARWKAVLERFFIGRELVIVAEKI